jgi:hypothetical protein
MPSNYAECRKAPDGAECKRIRSELLDWRHNLSETARTMATWRSFCGKKVGSRLAIHWLPGYQGVDFKRPATCGHRKQRRGWLPIKAVPKLSRKVLAKRQELEKRFAKHK